MDKYILIMFCIGGGLFFLIFGGIGLIKNYKVDTSILSGVHYEKTR